MPISDGYWSAIKEELLGNWEKRDDTPLNEEDLIRIRSDYNDTLVKGELIAELPHDVGAKIAEMEELLYSGNLDAAKELVGELPKEREDKVNRALSDPKLFRFQAIDSNKRKHRISVTELVRGKEETKWIVEISGDLFGDGSKYLGEFNTPFAQKPSSNDIIVFLLKHFDKLIIDLIINIKQVEVFEP